MRTPSKLTECVLERQGCPLHYWLGGPEERPLIAMMHGATMDHRMFNAQVEELINHYRVLVWDARGHGLSQPMGGSFSLELCADDMLAILDEVGVETAVLCGQSLGGYICQHIYMKAPERCTAMIIIGATPLAKAYGKMDIWMLKASLPMIKMWPYNHFAKTVAKSITYSADVQTYALDAIHQIERQDFLTIWEAVTFAIDANGMPDFHIDCPLLLTHGDKDTTGTIRKETPLWAQQEANCTYEVIPNARHNANQDNPSFTNELILSFLDGVFAQV